MDISLSSFELAERVNFETLTTKQPLQDTFQRALLEVGPKSSGGLIVLGRDRRGGINYKSETQHLLLTAGQTSYPGPHVSHVLGDICTCSHSNEGQGDFSGCTSQEADLYMI